MTKKMNESHTKKQILDAYAEVVAQLKASESSKLDPQKEVARKEATETLSKAAETVSVSVEDQIANLQKNFSGVLINLSNSFSEEINKFNNLKDAISLKEAELQELFGIEKEAYSLAALVNAHQELSTKLDVELAERKANAEAKIVELQKQAEEIRVNLQKEIADMKANRDLDRKRDKEEYEYNFAREKQIAKNALNDELAAQRKSFDANLEVLRDELTKDEAAVSTREAMVSEREAKMTDLEAAVAAFPAKEAQIRAEVAEQVKKDEARTAAIKDSYAKREAENQKTIYENKIELLEATLKSEQVKGAELAAKLDAAYEKIQAMALASVDGAKSQAAVAEFARNMGTQSQK